MPPFRRSQPSSAQAALLGLSLLLACVLARRDRPPLHLPPVPTTPACDVPMEWAGHGLLCLTTQDAARLGLNPGQRRAAERRTAPIDLRRLSGQRALLAGQPVDVQQADLADLIALPEIGETLARSIVAARQAGQLRCQAQLAAVPGLGSQRMRRLLRYIAPLPQDCPRTHPTK